MKILISIGSLSPRHGGPSKAAVEMAQALVERGHHVDIFTTDQDGRRGRLDVPTDKPVIKNGVAIYYFRAQLLSLWPCVSYGFWRAVKQRIASYDIVVSHSVWLFAGMMIGHYCRKQKVPYLIRPCGALDPYIFQRHRLSKELLERIFERRNFSHAAAIHFTTLEEMELARRAIPFKNGVVVPLGVRIEDYLRLPPKGAFRKAFPEVGDRRIILFLGRINFKKGLDLLISAFGELIHQHDDIHLVIAGPDEDGLKKSLLSLIEMQGLNSKVTFTGMLDGEIKLAALSDASMFVLPSYSENFGIAVVEAMACGLPVVISDKVNIWREVIAAGAGLATQCNAVEVARAIHTLLQTPELGVEMGKKGLKYVADYYSWPRVAESLEQTYRHLLTRERPAE